VKNDKGLRLRPISRVNFESLTCRIQNKSANNLTANKEMRIPTYFDTLTRLHFSAT